MNNADRDRMTADMYTDLVFDGYTGANAARETARQQGIAPGTVRARVRRHWNREALANAASRRNA